MNRTDRRAFLKIAASSLGIGVLYSAHPAARSAGEAAGLFSGLGKANGETVTPVLVCSTQRCTRRLQWPA